MSLPSLDSLLGQMLETALRKVDKLQKEAETINKTLSTAPKDLAQHLLE
jgi:hypothetical protein